MFGGRSRWLFHDLLFIGDLWKFHCSGGYKPATEPNELLANDMKYRIVKPDCHRSQEI